MESIKPEIKNSETTKAFKRSIINEYYKNSLFSVQDPVGMKPLSRLRLQLSHLYEHKFKDNFSDAATPICAFGAIIEVTEHLFLHCHSFFSQRSELLDGL